MAVITNLANSPLATCTLNVAINARVDFPGWNVIVGDSPASDIILSAYCTLVSGTGTLRFGWTTTTISASGRLTASPTQGVFPKVTLIGTGSAVWEISRLLAVRKKDYSRLQVLGLDYFDGDLMPINS